MTISNKIIRPLLFCRSCTRTLTYVTSLNFSTTLSQDSACPAYGKGTETQRLHTQGHPPNRRQIRAEINVYVIPEILEGISTLLFSNVSFQLASIGSPPAGKDIKEEKVGTNACDSAGLWNDH